MSSMNVISLVGNVGGNVHSNETKTGKKVANFSLATSRGFGENQTTDWHNIVVWEKLAETAEKYIKKGAKIGIVGRLGYEKFTNKDGVETTKAVITAHDLSLLSPKSESAPPADEKPPRKSRKPTNTLPADDDSLPF